MKISVIIPVLNEEFTITRTLESLFSQVLLPSEIVVADGGSTDRTMQVLGSYKNKGIDFRITKNRKRLPGAGRNEAVRCAKYDFIACIDAGNIADSRWLQELSSPINRDFSIDVVYGKYLLMPRTSFEECVVSINYSYQFSYFQNNKDGYVDDMERDGIPYTGTSVMFNKTAWEKAGGFPEWLKTGEDKLFGKNLVTAGCKLFFNHKAIVHHHVRENVFQLVSQVYSYGKGNGLSQQTSKGFCHLLGKYVAGCILLLFSVLTPSVILFLVLGVALYIYRQGYAPYKCFFQRVVDIKKFLIIPFVLFARDIGLILGHFAGYWEKYRNPAYQEMLSKYNLVKKR